MAQPVGGVSCDLLHQTIFNGAIEPRSRAAPVVAFVEKRSVVAISAGDFVKTACESHRLTGCRTPSRPGGCDAARRVERTDHPWAGAEVVMALTARDEGGNEGRSEPFTLHLPERAFTKPLAKALVEQRRNLALTPASVEVKKRGVKLGGLNAKGIAERQTRQAPRTP